MSDQFQPAVQAGNDASQQLFLPDVLWREAPDVCCSSKCGASFRFGRIQSGPGAGVEVVEIDCGRMQLVVLPTRGMSIWRLICDGIPFKWDSPIRGPIHPALVPVMDPSGIGWLEGFDEFLVRCGLTSNGAPEFDDRHNLSYPLHGRIANLPASKVWCSEESGCAVLHGEVHESRLFFNQLKLETSLRVGSGIEFVELVDHVTNTASRSGQIQMLYHINIGSPVLEDKARLYAPIAEMMPRDGRAVEASSTRPWGQYGPPESGYQEAVYFCKLNADASGQSRVLLQSSGEKADRGLGLEIDTGTLPYFTIWKNTADHRDGYVTGLEPGTNFPNRRSFEGQHGRYIELGPGESVSFRLRLFPLTEAAAVDRFRSQVDELMATEPTVHAVPAAPWADVWQS